MHTGAPSKFFFSSPVIIMFPLVVGKMPHRMVVLCTALSFDGKEQLPNCEQPENVSSCCSENDSSWLSHWELLPRKQPPPPPSPTLFSSIGFAV